MPVRNRQFDRKLTDEDVADILLIGRTVTGEALAERFDVALSTIQRIRRRKTKASLRVAQRLGLLTAPSPRRVRCG